jgi:hypothetical protein
VLATTFEVTVKFAVLCPAGTRTSTGTVAAPVLLLDKFTNRPAEFVGPSSVTVPVAGVPPVTVVGFKVRDNICGRRTVRVALRVVPFNAADMLTLVLPFTTNVVMGKVAEFEPAGTTTLGDTCAAGSTLLASATVVSTAVMPVRVTVPVDGLPPARLLGLRVTTLGVGAFTVIV